MDTLKPHDKLFHNRAYRRGMAVREGFFRNRADRSETRDFKEAYPAGYEPLRNEKRTRRQSKKDRRSADGQKKASQETS